MVALLSCGEEVASFEGSLGGKEEERRKGERGKGGRGEGDEGNGGEERTGEGDGGGGWAAINNLSLVVQCIPWQHQGGI